MIFRVALGRMRARALRCRRRVGRHLPPVDVGRVGLLLEVYDALVPLLEIDDRSNHPDEVAQRRNYTLDVNWRHNQSWPFPERNSKSHWTLLGDMCSTAFNAWAV